MSTFNGQITEIQGIQVDEFRGADSETQDVKAYFLSHFHSDHIRGLSELQTSSPIYTTPITVLLIQKKFPNLAENCRILEIGVPVSVELAENDEIVNPTVNFVVTAIPAGHCLGSCMLLFQIEGCDILYTGDFRISLKDTKNLKILKELKSQSNTVVYLDSTFMKATFENFPSQTESVRTVLEIVDKFLKESPKHKVNLMTPARYGYEYLLMELHSKLGYTTFVRETDVYEQYISISTLESCVTKNEKTARIFLTPTFLSNSPKSRKNAEILSIQLSAWYWSRWAKGTSFVKEIEKNHYRICYATHNSFSEIRDFLSFLKPKKVALNVLPENLDEKKIMLEQLELLQAKYFVEEKTTELYSKNSPKIEKEPKKFCFRRIKEMSQKRAEMKKKL